MCFREKMRRGISTVLAATMILGNTVNTAAALPQEEGYTAQSPLTVETGGYRAQIDWEKGQMLLSCNSDKSKDWNTADGISPGGMMFLDESGTARPAQATAAGIFANEDGSGGAAGIRMSGELSGVRSWFLFDSEILCLGAGIENSGTNTSAGAETGTEKLIHVIDNVPVDKNLKAAIPNPSNGFRNILTATQNPKVWASLLDTVTEGKHTRNWMTASNLTGTDEPLEWRYIFGDTITNSKIYYRVPTSDGKTAQRFELWTEPVQGAYQYTLGAGGLQGSFNNNTPAATENRVLSNTKELQAAESLSEGIFAVNKWTEGITELSGQVAEVYMDQPLSVFIRKTEMGDGAAITVAGLSDAAASFFELRVDLMAESVGGISDPSAVTDYRVEDGVVYLTLDGTKLVQPVTVNVQLQKNEYVTGETITLIRGQSVNVEKPQELGDGVTWSAKFQKKDGSFIRNVGSSKIKQELQEGQTDGTRTAGDTTAEHLLTVKTLSNGDAALTAREKGNIVLVARDKDGKEKVYPTVILYEDPQNLPDALAGDYAEIRKNWKESLIGTDLASQEGGAEILEALDREAGEAWNSYIDKGQDSCTDVPWENMNSVGNPNIPFADDAVEFRPAFKKVLAMSKAYATEGSQYYQNPEMFKDMVNIMDYLCGTCYTPKSQTDNWWTWEIGMPKDLIPILILLYDDLTKEQVMAYTEGLYFFQPDPFHEGVIGTASTHAQGYRTAQGANIIDCSTTAVGLGALREDNEQVYLGILASSQTFVIQQVKDSAALAQDGYVSGFYSDGSYLDHSHMPYLGAYGIEFMKGAVKIPSLIAGTPWQYPDEVQQNLEYYIVEGFGSSMYRGLMLDCLKGRSVSRPASSNRAAGREAMAVILQMVDSLSSSAKKTALSAMKYWLEEDPEFTDSLQGVENMAIKRKAEEILADSSIESYVPPMHKSFPLMDRAVHRRPEYLFALSMYSERIQNTEIMNDENKYGWHQGNGMTYIYDADNQYTENYWNTVNPLRLPGTTVVPVNIGNGKPDSSNYLQGGDFCSRESWVGGSSIGDYGISGMSFTGEIGSKGRSADSGEVAYAPNLRGKKSWFMFDEEIFCLGAGIANTGMDLPVETTIENRKLGEDAENTLTVNGEVTELPVKEASLSALVNRSADVAGTPAEDAVWAHLEGTNTEGTGYYFPNEHTQIRLRKARTTGNWKDVGTSEGESTQNYLEMWIDHGVNPTDASYAYVLLPGKSAAETEAYAKDPRAVILKNTDQVQAVYHEELGITGMNFWEDQEVTVGDVTCDKQASVMLREDKHGLLEVAVSDPTMKNKGTIKVTIHRPVVSAEELDDNVSCEILEDQSAVLTFRMKGTNGASSSAQLQLAASVIPSAAVLKPGDSRMLQFMDYQGDAGKVNWSVKGSEPLAAKTSVDSSGILWVDPTETNKAFVVTAKTESGLTLNVYISLGGEVIEAELPEDMKKVELTISQAIKMMNELGAEDPETEKALRKAILAAEKADSDRLAEYLMDELLELAELYMEIRSEAEYSVDERLEVKGKLIKELNLSAKAMVLNIPPSDKSSSTAILVVSGEDAESASQKKTENPARKATASTASRKATPSEALKKTENRTAADASRTATPSAASRASRRRTAEEVQLFREEITEINQKTVAEESISRFLLQLFQETEEEETLSLLKQKIPYMLTMNLPDNMNPEKPILALIIDEEGKQHPLPVKWNKEEKRLTMFPTRTGTVILANEETSLPEEPEKPEEPDIPEKPVTPEEPEKPAEEIIRRRRYASNDKADSGWIQINGRWKYQRSNGRYAKDCWEFIDQQWYCFDADGNMRTGWYQEIQDGHWYYLKPDGAMAVGWQMIGGTWYYFHSFPAVSSGWSYIDGTWKFQAVQNSGILQMPQGALYQSAETPDGYLVDDQGRWKQ